MRRKITKVSHDLQKGFYDNTEYCTAGQMEGNDHSDFEVQQKIQNTHLGMRL